MLERYIRLRFCNVVECGWSRGQSKTGLRNLMSDLKSRELLSVHKNHLWILNSDHCGGSGICISNRWILPQCPFFHESHACVPLALRNVVLGQGLWWGSAMSSKQVWFVEAHAKLAFCSPSWEPVLKVGCLNPEKYQWGRDTGEGGFAWNPGI